MTSAAGDRGRAFGALRQLLGDRFSTAASPARAARPRRGLPCRHRRMRWRSRSRPRRWRHRRALRRAWRAGDRVRRRHVARGPRGGASAAGSRIDLTRMNRVAGGPCRGPRLPPCRPASPASSSTRTCATPACSSRSIPGANATIGGMAATRASGTNAVRYGTMRENVLGLTVVTGRRQHHPDRRPRAQVRPPATTSRGCSSAPRARSASSPRSRSGSTACPEAISAAVCSFPERRRARSHAVIATIQSGIPVARIELLDDVQMRGVHRLLASSTGYREAPTLFFEFHGSEAGVRGAGASRRGDRRRSMAARTSSGRPGPRSATGSGRPGTTPTTPPWRCARARGWATDVCVPISRLAECIRRRSADVAATASGADRRPCRRRQFPSR